VVRLYLWTISLESIGYFAPKSTASNRGLSANLNICAILETEVEICCHEVEATFNFQPRPPSPQLKESLHRLKPGKGEGYGAE